MENYEIILKNAFNNEDTSKIFDMMNNEEGINDIFRNRLDRLMTSEYSRLIIYDYEEIGFVNLVREKCDENFLFLDMGIKEAYRGKGIGKRILKKLVKIDFEDFIIIETKEDNESAVVSAKQVGCYLTTIAGKNYYLLQRDRLEEFIDFDGMSKLAQHLEKVPKKVLSKR